MQAPVLLQERIQAQTPLREVIQIRIREEVPIRPDPMLDLDRTVAPDLLRGMVQMQVLDLLREVMQMQAPDLLRGMVQMQAPVLLQERI
ncbi:hypothetical protein LEP1GSC051_2672 [Leptospira sp. P2653]|nr:hypothetical protein LEP1GSC051_2672 [Leptospira sp. P2653]